MLEFPEKLHRITDWVNRAEMLRSVRSVTIHFSRQVDAADTIALTGCGQSVRLATRAWLGPSDAMYSYRFAFAFTYRFCHWRKWPVDARAVGVSKS